ncbi:MAG: DUF47 domain-containing protein [Candidatus Eisenbacteria bacterium]
MGIDRFIHKLLPREDRFLSLFVQDVENIRVASEALCTLVDTPSAEERNRLIQQIEEHEHKGDELTHRIFRQLGKSFITPLDREDIAGLAASLDDVMDHVDRAATSISLYRLVDFDDTVRDLSRIIARQAVELNRAIPLLHDLRQADVIRESSVRVNAYENQADDIFHRALARLFQEEKDPIELIKRRELLAVLEAATDQCENVAVLIENVLVKYS